MMKRILSALTVLCLMLTLLPAGVLAAQPRTADQGTQAADLSQEGAWFKDRSKPETWTISDGKLRFTVDAQQQSDSWYDWQGLKAYTELGATGFWSVEYTLDVTADMLEQENTNASLWIQVDAAGGNTAESQQDCVDWAILQFLNQDGADACWQSWDANGSGTWKTIEGLTPTEGTHTVQVTFMNGTIRQYIDGALVNRYAIAGVTETAPAAVIAQARSHGASFDVAVGIPQFKLDTLEAADADALLDAAAAAGKGDTIRLTDDIVIDGSSASANASVVRIASDGVTLDGNGHTITARNFTNKANVIGIEGCDGVRVENLTIAGDATTKHGVNVYKSTDVTLSDLSISGVGGLGLIINASDVTVTGGLTLRDNGWGARINVGFGSGITGVEGASLDASQATLTGVEQVYADEGDVTRGGGKDKFHIQLPASFVDMGVDTAISYVPAVAEVDGVRYPSLAAAVEAAQDKTVNLLADVTVEEKLIIDHSVTVEGNGHTITGLNDSTAAYFEITGGTVVFRNAVVTGFGGNAGAANGWGLFLVPSTAEGVNFTAENLTVSNFNRGAFDINAGTFAIVGCRIDCADSYAGDALTKGVKAAYNAVGQVKDTVITNSGSSYDSWSSAGIELWDNAEVDVSGCTIEKAANGVYVYADSYAQLADTSARLTLTDTTVNVDGYALQMGYVAGDGIAIQASIASGTYTGKLGILEYTFHDDGTPDSEIVHTENTDSAAIAITGGTFSEDPGSFAAPGYWATGEGPYVVSLMPAAGGGGSGSTTPTTPGASASDTATVTTQVSTTVSTAPLRRK